MKIKSLLIVAGMLATSLALTSEAQARGGTGRGGGDRDRGRVAERGPDRGARDRVPVIVEPGPARGRYAPARRVAPFRRPHFRPGYWTVQTYQVWEPGFYRTEFVPPVYQDIVNHRGFSIRICIREGYSHQLWVPGRYVTQTRRVWIPPQRIFYR